MKSELNIMPGVKRVSTIYSQYQRYYDQRVPQPEYIP